MKTITILVQDALNQVKTISASEALELSKKMSVIW